jgi:hypothetical protein
MTIVIGTVICVIGTMVGITIILEEMACNRDIKKLNKWIDSRRKA